ncbi:MAG: chemotaxis protein CheW [Cyanobacteriota bacterium]|nr:chemotaxis protein CheW [Cyanobacteriota bacterium]
MFSSSSLQSRRTKNRASRATEQLIAFSLREEWFALPIWVARKVILLGKVYGSAIETGTGLTLDGDLEVPVLDLEHRLFGPVTGEQTDRTPQTNATPESEEDEKVQHYLLIVQNSDGEDIGLPLPSQPVLRRFRETDFKPIPSAYRVQGHLRCAIALVVPSADEPPLFLLDLERLVRPQWSLPPSVAPQD